MFGKRFSRALAVTTVASLIMATAAFADNVANEIDTTGTILTIVKGDTAGASANWKINGSGGDGQSGCNVDDGTAATMSFVGLPTGVTADPNQPQFTLCGNGGEKAVTFTATSAATAGDYAITVSIADAGVGTYNVSGGAFTLRIANPVVVGDTTDPTDASIEINDGATWTNSASFSLDFSAADNVGISRYRLAESEAGLATAADVTVDPSEASLSRINQAFAFTGTDGASAAVWLQVFDAAGNSDTASDTIGLDRVAPTVTCVAASFILNQPNATVSANVTDALSLPVNATETAAADTTSAGTGKTVSITGSDNAGNSTTVTCSYSVGYNFEGLYAPVDRPNTLNVSKAGQAIPLKWRLTDFYGAGVTDVAAVTVGVGAVACSTSATLDTVEEYAGSSGLQNLGDGYYQFNWKTPTNYANTCKTLGIKMGTAASDAPVFSNLANFNFKK